MDKNIKFDAIKESMPSDENMELIPPSNEEISLGNLHEQEENKPKENDTENK